jgi:hypothetical protein
MVEHIDPNDDTWITGAQMRADFGGVRVRGNRQSCCHEVLAIASLWAMWPKISGGGTRPAGVG